MTAHEHRGRRILGRIWVLMVTVFVDMVGFLIVLPLLPFYAERFGATPSTVGLLIAVYALAQITTAPLWGRLSDRIGRKPVLLAGTFASAVAYLLFGLADSLWMLVACRVVQGAGGGTIGVVQAYVGDAVDAEDRTQALGWLTAATSAGVMLGPVLGSLAVGWGDRAPGFAAAALCGANLLFAARWLPEAAAPVSTGARPPLLPATWAVLRHPRSPRHRLIWVYAAGMMAFMAMNGVLALYLERRFGVRESSIGYFYLFAGGVSLVARAFLLGPLVRRLGERMVLAWGAVTLGAGQALMPLAGTMVGFALALALVPLGTALIFPATTSLVSREAPAGQLGLTLGVQQAFGGVSRMLGPAWAGLAFEHLGIGAPFWLAALLVGATFLMIVALLREGAATATTRVAPPPAA